MSAPTKASPAFVGAALLVLASCASPTPRAELEPAWRALETGTPAAAMEAGDRISEEWTDAELPRLARALDLAPARALDLAGRLSTEAGARLLLERLPALLDGESSRMAVTAAGLRRLRGATLLLLERFEKLEHRALLRALGRIWDRRLSDPPLGRDDEVLRLSTLAIAHRATMTDLSPDAAETMFRAMTRDELADFLGKHAAGRFAARKACDEAVRRKGFDPEKGARIHEALLGSEDAALVAAILLTSPHALREPIVRSFLDDRRVLKPDYFVCDAAASRLSGKSPSTRPDRDALLKTLKP